MIKNVFLWCHVRHINPLREHPERITKIDRVQNNICISVFCYENEMVFPIYVSDQIFENSIDLLLLINDNKSHYVYLKDFNTFTFHKTKNQNKKWFCRSCLRRFSSENVLINHKEDCLSIIGKQSVNLEKETIEFENYFKQLPVPFKIYADFECNLRDVEIYEGFTQKNIMNMFLVVMLTKLLVLMIDLVSQLLFLEVKILLMNLLKHFFKSISIVKK